MKFVKSVKWFFFVPLFVSIIFYAEREMHHEPVPQVTKHVNMKELHCLAKNIYYEARKEPVNGQAAVARVVMNRVNHGFASTPCKVIYQVINVPREDRIVKVCQFSWVCENKPEPNRNNAQYQQALNIAFEVLVQGKHKDVVSKNTLFFHASYMDPNWPYKRVKQIGNHIFYQKA
jgi:spore germination cell wall hydrolase CwlJ-like protein